MNIKTFTTSVLVLAMLSSTVLAKVSTDEAAKLGASLTAVGAEKAGNTAGTIPVYKGGLTSNLSADPFKDVFANEKPLFTITAKNIEQYKANLSGGQIALFKKYPDTYKMPIYTTHRTSVFPKNVQIKAKKNATTAELVDGGNGMKSFDETVPFAIPQSGLEVMWNHVSRYRGGSIERNLAIVPVQQDGAFTVIKVRSQLTAPQYLSDAFDAQADGNVLYLSLIHI